MSEKEIQVNNVTFRFFAEPGDVNFGGIVHGGAVMKWLDQAGYACATGWAKEYCVTVYVGGIHFVRPIEIGDIVQVNAKVIHTGRTSIHLILDVKAKQVKNGEYKVTTHCLMVFVALDRNGQKTEVPEWKPITLKEIAAEKIAIDYMEMRQKLERAIGTLVILP